MWGKDDTDSGAVLAVRAAGPAQRRGAPGGRRHGLVNGLTIGVEHTVMYRVGERQMVRRLLPDIDEFTPKPEVVSVSQ